MLDRNEVENILNKYGQAWVEQDTDLILEVFTEDGIYHEFIFLEPMVGHEAIKNYWETRIKKEEASIHFELLNFYIEDQHVIAEWKASFDYLPDRKRVEIQEVAILTIENNKIHTLREYWQTHYVD
jgi:hypothetical protein